MKCILLSTLLFSIFAAQAAGPQFAPPPVPAGVRVVPSFMAPPLHAVPFVPAISATPSVPPVAKVAPAPGSGSLGPPLPRSFSGASALIVALVSGPAAPVPTLPGSIDVPVFPPSAGAILNNGPREAHPGVFLDLSNGKVNPR